MLPHTSGRRPWAWALGHFHDSLENRDFNKGDRGAGLRGCRKANGRTRGTGTPLSAAKQAAWTNREMIRKDIRMMQVCKQGERGERYRKHRRLSDVWPGKGGEARAERSQVNQSYTTTVNVGYVEKIKTHMNWEKAGEIVSPVIPSSQYNPLLYPILLNGLDIIANPKFH